MTALRLSPKLRLANLWPALAALSTAALLLFWLVPRLVQQSAGEQLQDGIDVLVPLVSARLSTGARGDGDGDDTFQSWVRRLAADSDLRITVVATDGRVLADSDRTPTQLERMDDHSDRPEIRQARDSGRGVAVRSSATTGRQYVYAARDVRDGPGAPYVLRLAEPLGALEQMRGGLVLIMLLAVAIALLVMVTISWWLDRRLFRPLAVLIDGAGKIAQGEYRHRVELPEEDEVAQLGKALNHLAARVEEQIDAVRAERDHLRAILASMSEGVLVVGSDGRAVSANESFYRLLEVREPAEGKLPLEITRRVELAALIEDTLAQGEPGRREIALRSPRSRVLALTSAALSGPESGAVVVVRDTTEATRLNQVRRDFVANVSHELKTPLAAIRAYAETLRDGAIDDAPTARRFTDRILDQCRRLQALLHDLLTLSKLESVEVEPLRRDPVDLVRVARRAAELVAPRARERRVGIDVSAEGGDIPEVPGDAESLERMMVNLLENAVKYNHPDGWVRVGLGTSGDSAGPSTTVLVEVEDGGIGIPADALPRVFERFYRVDKGRSRDEGGTGLGLAIVKHVVQSHGGEIEVESDVGLGTTFRIRFPAVSKVPVV